MLRGELGGRGQLDRLRVPQGALREGREPADLLDLVAEELQPGGALLGGGEHVEDPAADRELPPLLDLIDALIASLDELRADVREVDGLTACEREPSRAQGCVRHRLGEGDRARHDHRRLGLAERIERRDSQPDEVRRGREVRGVTGPPRRVVADPPGRQEGAKLARQVARPDVVRCDHQHGAPAEAVCCLRQRGEQVGANRGRHVHGHAAALAGGARQRAKPLVLEGDVEQGAKAHVF